MGDMADFSMESADWPEDRDFEEEREREESGYWKICKYCGKSGLIWGQVNGKWRLFEGDDVHDCPRNPLPRPPKPRPKPEPLEINDYMEFPFGQLRVLTVEIRSLIRSGEHIDEYDMDSIAKNLMAIAADLVRGQAVQEWRIKHGDPK